MICQRITQFWRSAALLGFDAHAEWSAIVACIEQHKTELRVHASRLNVPLNVHEVWADDPPSDVPREALTWAHSYPVAEDGHGPRLDLWLKLTFPEAPLRRRLLLVHEAAHLYLRPEDGPTFPTTRRCHGKPWRARYVALAGVYFNLPDLKVPDLTECPTDGHLDDYLYAQVNRALWRRTW